ncbi:hypothetical protein E3N88_18172 [Mikania micrantha]|uniref:Uncharacterized protein n=1 Tax=Mikania micrantha TaxID=192012 RepID=A0A5N6NU47_9ASTR|nr:hypothetical protein E3N88_18172 [Mikania micrantha]
MLSKRFLLVLALVLALTSEIGVAKELASNHESDLEDVKYDQVRWFVNRRLSQLTYPGPYNGGGYGLPPGVPCCGGQAKPVHKQAHVVQPHN